LRVLLLVRIHESFGIELSIDDVYSAGLTLAELAQRIDLLQLGDLDSAEYAELLQEIEAMSDDEVRHLLAEVSRRADPPDIETAAHSPPRGGSTRSNLIWLEHLASSGHECRVVCSGEPGDASAGGVAILSVKDLVRNRCVLSAEIRGFRPDFVLVSSRI